MKTLSEMKQHIIEQAILFNSIDAEDIDVESEVTTDIIEFALNGNYIKNADKERLQKLLDEDGEKIYEFIGIKETSNERNRLYYNLIKAGKVSDEVVELEKLFLKEFFNDDNFNDHIETNIEFYKRDNLPGKVDLSKIIQLMRYEKSNSILLKDLFVEIIIGRERIQNKESQSFYFLKGIKSEERKLKKLEDKYEQYRNYVNEHSHDNIKAELDLYKQSLVLILRNESLPNDTRELVKDNFNPRIRLLQISYDAKKWIEQKGKHFFGSIDYYLENEDRLLEFWEFRR